MIIAKLTATLGSALLLAGTVGSLPPSSLAVGAVLFLISAAIGAVVLEGRDLEHVAGLSTEPIEQPTQPTSSVLDGPMQPAA